MTDTSGVEHVVAVGGAIVTGTLALLAWASGDKEGRQIAGDAARDAASGSVRDAVGSGIIDREAYRALVDGIEAMTKRLDALDGKVARLVTLGEGGAERGRREEERQGLRDAMVDLAASLREEMRLVAERV